MPDLYSLLRPPSIYLILGIVFLVGAVLATCTGKARTWGYGWVYRTQERGNFWSVVVICYFAGVICIGIFLYMVT